MTIFCVARNRSKNEWVVVAVGHRSFTRKFYDYKKLLDFLRKEGNELDIIERVAIRDYFGNTTESAMQCIFGNHFVTVLPCYNVENENSRVDWMEDAFSSAIYRFSLIKEKLVNSFSSLTTQKPDL